jgi:peroxiredoxin
MCHLQQLYETYQDQGLVILGFTFEEKNLAKLLLRENQVTFPNIRDGSRLAFKVMDKKYKGGGGVPLHYIIDREGKVVEAWYGSDKGNPRALAALQRAGLEIEDQHIAQDPKHDEQRPGL